MKRLLVPTLAALTLMISAVGCCHRSCYDPSVACNCGTWQPLNGGWSDWCCCSHPWSPGPCCGPMYGGCGYGCGGCGVPQPCGCGEPFVPPTCGCAGMPCAGPVMDNCGCGAAPPCYQPGPVPAMQPAPVPNPAPPVDDKQTYLPGNYYQTSPQMMYSSAQPQLMTPGVTYNMTPVPNGQPVPIVPAGGAPQQWVPARN